MSAKQTNQTTCKENGEYIFVSFSSSTTKLTSVHSDTSQSTFSHGPKSHSSWLSGWMSAGQLASPRTSELQTTERVWTPRPQVTEHWRRQPQEAKQILGYFNRWGVRDVILALKERICLSHVKKIEVIFPNITQ